MGVRIDEDEEEEEEGLGIDLVALRAFRRWLGDSFRTEGVLGLGVIDLGLADATLAGLVFAAARCGRGLMGRDSFSATTCGASVTIS